MGRRIAETAAPPRSLADAFLRAPPAMLAALLIAAGSGAIVLGAQFFEHVVGVPPCSLCLQQRQPHYVAIAVALAVVAALRLHAPRVLVAVMLAVLVAALLTTAAIGAYHAGVEWRFWLGPADCTGPVTSFGAGGSLLEQMNRAVVIRCDEVKFRLFGLSLAGYNVLMSLALAAIGSWALGRTLRGRSHHAG